MAALEGKNVIITGVLCPFRIASLSVLFRYLVRTADHTTSEFSGGGRGIGYAFAEGVVETGGNVAILDVLDEPGEECAALIAKVPGRCHYIKYVQLMKPSSDPFRHSCHLLVLPLTQLLPIVSEEETLLSKNLSNLHLLLQLRH
jgi:NAD(P)-dependent dehydrogenase (short-subunit alcohol dehydrogenase family)